MTRQPFIALRGVLDAPTARQIFNLCRTASGASSDVYKVTTIVDRADVGPNLLGLCETTLLWQPGHISRRYVLSNIKVVRFHSRRCGVSVLVHELAHAFNPDWGRFAAEKEGPPPDYDAHGRAWKLTYASLLQATAEKYPEAAWPCFAHTHFPSATEVLQELGSAAAWASYG